MSPGDYGQCFGCLLTEVSLSGYMTLPGPSVPGPSVPGCQFLDRHSNPNPNPDPIPNPVQELTVQKLTVQELTVQEVSCN